MLDVCFTVDVEIWCDGWADLDRQFLVKTFLADLGFEECCGGKYRRDLRKELPHVETTRQR
jgi:hypothetical protein